MPFIALSPTPNASAVDYCRRARRLRARFGGDPGRLQVALHELARAEDSRPRVDDLSNPAPGPARLFCSRVAAALDEGVLRYSARKDLLREAARMGLGNFEATLLIAAVQHGERGSVRTLPRDAAPRSSSSTPLIALIALALQTVIAATVWWVVHA